MAQYWYWMGKYFVHYGALFRSEPKLPKIWPASQPWLRGCPILTFYFPPDLGPVTDMNAACYVHRYRLFHRQIVWMGEWGTPLKGIAPSYLFCTPGPYRLWPEVLHPELRSRFFTAPALFSAGTSGSVLIAAVTLIIFNNVALSDWYFNKTLYSVYLFLTWCEISTIV